MGLGFSAASYNDTHGEQITHSDCAVTGKSMSQRSRGQAQERYNYYAESTCGKFAAEKDTYDKLELNKIYELVTTAGNSVTKPTIISFTGSQ